MAITFPLPLAAAFDLLPIGTFTFDLPPYAAMPRTRGGELIPVEIGTRLWGGEIQLGPMLPDEYRIIRPLLTLLGSPGASWLVTDPSRRRPAYDPTGTRLGAAAPEIAFIAANNRELSLRQLPGGYEVRSGDLLSFSYGAPSRAALHEVVTGAASNPSTGITGMLEVMPPLRPGAAVGAKVQLINPTCRALMVPYSMEPGRRSSGLIQDVSFRWQQTLRS